MISVSAVRGSDGFHFKYDVHHLVRRGRAGGRKKNKDSDSSSQKMMDGAKGSPIISLFVFLSESLQVNKKKKS